MPAPAAEATATREGDVLRLRGAVVREAVPALWRAVRAAPAGLRRIDIASVGRIDSAGLALLATLADGGIVVEGDPPGLAGLRAAYRLDAGLGFAS